MTTWLPASKWKAKGPQSVSAKIRQKKSKKVKVAKKNQTIAKLSIDNG